MKKLCALLGCLALVFGLLTAACVVSAEDATAPVESSGKNTSAAKAMALTEVGVIDSLNKESAQRWYTVDVTVSGDAVVTFHYERSNYQNDVHWECTFFAAMTPIRRPSYRIRLQATATTTIPCPGPPTTTMPKTCKNFGQSCETVLLSPLRFLGNGKKRDTSDF